jgi:peptidoglycan/xylan/chitin deacetylase (PgdA/CDA1 family)
MYHCISEDSEEGTRPYYRLNTSPGRFAQQIQFLADHHYQVISLREALDLLCQPISSSKDITNNHVVITFDDGYADFYEKALPIIEANGLACTVYLPAGLMGQEINRRACMTWDQARELVNRGISIGSHSLNHLKIVELNQASVEAEILLSKARLERELNQDVDSFSYPYAFPEHHSRFLRQYESLLQAGGYKSGVTTMIGTASSRSNPFFLERIPINDQDDLRLFEAKLKGGYDWLYFYQSAFKRAKKLLRAH